MPHYIGSSLLRGTLQAVKRASGPQYATLLAQAGMLRYLETLPPPDDSPSCTAEEYSRLPAAVFAMLGEPLTRSFLRNLGTRGAHRRGAADGRVDGRRPRLAAGGADGLVRPLGGGDQ